MPEGKQHSVKAGSTWGKYHEFTCSWGILLTLAFQTDHISSSAKNELHRDTQTRHRQDLKNSSKFQKKKEILIVWLRAENTDQATYKPDLEACMWPIYKAATISVLGGCAMVLLPALPQICPKYRPQKVVLVASGALSLQCGWENCSDFLAPSLSPSHCKHLENEQNDKNSVYHPVCFSVSLHFFARYLKKAMLHSGILKNSYLCTMGESSIKL